MSLKLFFWEGQKGECNKLPQVNCPARLHPGDPTAFSVNLFIVSVNSYKDLTLCKLHSSLVYHVIGCLCRLEAIYTLWIPNCVYQTWTALTPQRVLHLTPSRPSRSHWSYPNRAAWGRGEECEERLALWSNCRLLCRARVDQEVDLK